MDFQFTGLDERPFLHLFDESSDSLAGKSIKRMIVDSCPGYPCRVSLEDATIGETVLLLNYEHLAAPSIFRSRHAIFVRKGVQRAVINKNVVPEFLNGRMLSVRAFDANKMMLDADVVSGHAVEPLVRRLFSADRVDFLHVHNAARGCFLAQVNRA